MSRPDVTINITAAATPRTVPTDTGTSFAVGLTQRGSTIKPAFLRSLQDFLSYCGARMPSSSLYDWVETFFAEGGTRLYVQRKYGAGALQATLNLMDAGAGVSLVVKAGSYGDPDPGIWANGATGGLSVAVVATGSGFQLQTYLNSVFVEASPLCASQADVVAWSNNPTSGSKYISVTLGATALNPAPAAAASLAGGTDGAAIVVADQQIALDKISKLLGPGQISAPGATDATSQLQVIAHAVANNRWALLDAADTPSQATLSTAAAALYGAPSTGRRWGQLLAPWDVVPGLTSLTTRTVPPSARQAAQYARIDALGNPNQAAAGDNGIAQFAIDLSQPSWSDADRELLNANGVTVSRRRYAGLIKTYGARNLADQTLDKDWSWAPNIRTIMAYVARAYAVGEAHEFKQIDGQGRELSAFKADLTGPLLDLFNAGALYGASPLEAFYVDVGPGVNPVQQLAQNIMAANVKLRTSPGAEAITINIIKTPITQAV